MQIPESHKSQFRQRESKGAENPVCLLAKLPRGVYNSLKPAGKEVAR